MNSFNKFFHSINDRISHAFGLPRRNRLEVYSREATSSKSDLNDEGQQCGQSEDKSSDNDCSTTEEPNTDLSNVTLQKSASNGDASYVNQYKPNNKASTTPTDQGKAYDGQNKTVCCDSSKSGSKSNTVNVKETLKQIKSIADPKTLAETAQIKPDAVRIKRSPSQHRTVNSTFLTNIAAVSKPTKSNSLGNIEANPGPEASKLDTKSCTESKEFRRKVIGEGTNECGSRETNNKRTVNKQMARKPKGDFKPSAIHSTETDHDKQKQSQQNTPKLCSTTQDSPNLQPHSVLSVSHQASSKSRKLNNRGNGLLGKNKPNKTVAEQAQTDTLDKIVVSLKTGKPSLTSNTDTLSSCKTTKYRSPSITTNNGPKEMVQPINKTAEENVAVVKPKIVAVCSKQTGTKNKNNKSQKDVFVKEEKPNRSDIGKERNHCDAAALPINKHLLSDPVYDMPQNGEFSLAFLSKKLCLDHDNMHHHLHVYPPHIRASKKVNRYIVYYNMYNCTSCYFLIHIVCNSNAMLLFVTNNCVHTSSC